MTGARSLALASSSLTSIGVCAQSPRSSVIHPHLAPGVISCLQLGPSCREQWLTWVAAMGVSAGIGPHRIPLWSALWSSVLVPSPHAGGRRPLLAHRRQVELLRLPGHRVASDPGRGNQTMPYIFISACPRSRTNRVSRLAVRAWLSPGGYDRGGGHAVVWRLSVGDHR